MKVSILVPIYGVEKYIERCARSLFNQTYDNIEYIFVDDCTKDRSLKVLQSVIESFPNRKDQVKIVRHHENLGLAGARNTALDNATGDYIWHIDSDDEILPGSVELLCQKANESDADIVIFDVEHKLINGNTYIEHSNIGDGRYGHYGAILERRTPVYLVAHFVKREIAVREDARPVKDINYGEDFLVTPRISFYASNISYIQKPLYIYHHANEGSYTNNMTRKNIDNLIAAFDVLKKFFMKKLDPETASELISRGEIMNKLTISLVCSYDDFGYVKGLYPWLRNGNDGFLKPRHKLLWFFLKRNNFYAIKFYRFIRSKLT